MKNNIKNSSFLILATRFEEAKIAHGEVVVMAEKSLKDHTKLDVWRSSFRRA